MPKLKKKEIVLEYQNYILQPPFSPKDLKTNVARFDDATITKWQDQWISQTAANKEKFGSFEELSVSRFWGKGKYKPAIIAGSGPSLKNNGHELGDRGDIPLMSCLHNYHYFHDNKIKVDFYLSLDAGEITISEIAEGGEAPEEEYWESTKDNKLLCWIGTHPKLLEKWKGEIYFFNHVMPDTVVKNKLRDIEKFNLLFSAGGNVLGACLYFAKAIYGANPVAFVGADFAFGYEKKFHPWDSQYDKDIGICHHSFDIFGNRVLTWPSYYGFKCFFDYVAITIPGFYVNCSEGGTLGSYPEGNLMQIKQMDLCDFYAMYNQSDELKRAYESAPEQDVILY